MPKIVTKKGPFIKDNNSTFKMMNNLFIALLPIILFSVYKNGYLPYKNGDTTISGLFRPLILILVPTITGVITELLYYWLIKKQKGKQLIFSIKSSFCIFSGLFLGLILPINTPLLIVVIGSLFTTIIGKLVYGGFGHNIFNPALVGRIFIIFTYALTITNNGGYLNPTEIDAVTKATPLSNVVDGIGTYDTLVKPYGNLMNFLIGTIPGSIGETSALLCIIGFIYLTFKKVIKWVIPVIYILTVFIITFIIGSINDLGIWYPLFQILSGGLLFGAVFMATDPVTSPVTKQGQVIYGFMLGILTVIFRYLTPFPEGVLTSILTMNALVFILDKIGVKAKKDKKIMPLIITGISILSIIVSITIATTIETKNKDFEIISKETNGNNTTYIVSTKGYGGNIKAELIVTENEVIKYTVLEQNDSFYGKINDSNYIDTLLESQYQLDNIDTVTGATVTSSALKKLIINVIDDYTNGNGFVKKDEPIIEVPDFQILSKEEIDGKLIYIVNQKSFGEYLELEVTIIDNEIIEINVLKQNDSYFDKILEEDYINSIIENQNNLESLDSVTGATVSSEALKNAIINVLEDNLKNNDLETDENIKNDNIESGDIYE